MFIWTEINGKQTFINDHEIDPCDDCGEYLGTCELNGCVEGDLECEAEKPCWSCGAPNAYACHCDNDYESAVGK